MRTTPAPPAPTVLVRGEGVAAAACAHLLARAGLRVAVQRRERRGVPALLLTEPALRLMREVFDQPRLLADQPRIDRRVVAWGAAAPQSLPHEAAIVSEAALHDALPRAAEADLEDAPEFLIHARTPLPPPVTVRRFGARPAYAAEASLRRSGDRSTCMTESVADGWLFLVPDGRGSAWLLAVGGEAERLLAQSRLIAPRIDLGEARAGMFDPNPRLGVPAAGERWLACGAAAAGFDPICGDGTAQALRQAILAAAVVVGIAQGGDAPRLASHYDAVLVAALRRHLALCAQFYQAGGEGAWWQDQLAALAAGHAWCTERLAQAGEPAYRLVDFSLVQRAAAA